MHLIDWIIIGAYLAWIAWDGLRLSKQTEGLEGYLLAGRSLPWWAVGLSVMATQLSAITMIGTTGQGYADGMRLLQQYFALPIAMIVPENTTWRSRALVRMRPPGVRGGCSIVRARGGSMPSASAGGPSMIRFTQSTWIAVNGTGRPVTVEPSTVRMAPTLVDSWKRTNWTMFE